MAPQRLLTLLHISDFHYSKRKQQEYEIVVSALVRDLEKLCIGHRKPDIVFITGDLVQAAGLDSHDDAYDVLIDRVAKATSTADERIFITPGNHDLSWTNLMEFSEKHHEWRSVLGKNNEMDELNKFYEMGEFNAATESKFANFYDLDRILGGEERKKTRKFKSSFAFVDHIEILNMDIITLNTAVLSAGGHKNFEPDERRLAIPEYAILDIIGKLTKDSIRIFTAHHPLSMLTEQSAKLLEKIISEHGTFHLFGHMHDAQPRSLTGIKGSVLSNQSGAIFTARKDNYNGYSLITYDPSHKYSEFLLRAYYPERDAFDDALGVVERGKWYPTQEARQHFYKIAEPLDVSSFRVHLAGEALQRLVDVESKEGAEGLLHKKFVAPPLRRTFICESASVDEKVESETPVSFESVVISDMNHIIYAHSEYGRTTLLKEIRYRILCQAKEINYPRLPILIDFESISSNADSMLRLVKGRAEQVPKGHDVEALLRLGHACVLIDDVYFDQRVRMKVLRDFVERFPKARYVLSSPQNSATKYGANVNPELAVRFEFIEVRELRRNDMRQLLQNCEQCTDVEGWLDRLQSEFREINLPFTAANGSILIEILSDRYNFTPINRAVLMEQFIDTTLRKAAIEQSKRETFDYTNKIDLLAHVASWMAKIEYYNPYIDEMRAEMQHYLRNKGLKASLDELMREFLSAKIFINRHEDRVSFRYKGVLEYFISIRMGVDLDFKNWVLNDEVYLRFTNEILYFAGKNRNDPELINLVSRRYLEIVEFQRGEAEIPDLSSLDKQLLPKTKDKMALNEAVETIFGAPLTNEQKDAELEDDDPLEGDDRQEVFRPTIDKNSPSTAMLSLSLYSGLLKNMELIDDADKRRHLKIILDGWSGALYRALRLAPRLVQDRRIRVNGALYVARAPQGMARTSLLQKMMILLPHIHIRLLTNSVGTEKLEQQLTSPDLGGDLEPKIHALLKAGIISELRLDATPKAIKKLVSHFRDNSYLLWSLVVHIGELKRLNLIKPDHFSDIDAPIASAIAILDNGKNNHDRSYKNKVLNRLKKDRLFIKMKPEMDN